MDQRKKQKQTNLAMEIVSEKDANKALDFLSQGKVLAFPTETSYGLGCDARYQEAVYKIFRIKERSSDMPLLVVVSSVEEAKKYLQWNELLDKLSKRYWPGALTVVAKASEAAKDQLARGVVSDRGTLALRVTEFNFLRHLTEKVGSPLVATSANLSGEDNIYKSEEVKRVFKKRIEKPDALIDGGTLLERSSSTLVSVIDNELKILRQGEVDIDTI